MNKIFVVLIGIIFICLVGCSNTLEKQYIHVEKRNGTLNEYEDFKEITNTEKVQRIKEIINDIDWEVSKVEMDHPPDYRFSFQYEDPNIEAKAVLYEVWKSPNKDKVEIAIYAENKYAQLDKRNSATLFEIITGEKLSH